MTAALTLAADSYERHVVDLHDRAIAELAELFSVSRPTVYRVHERSRSEQDRA